MTPSTRSKILLGAEEARRRRHGTGECSDDRQHHYVVIGQPGLRSPVCVYCGNKWHRRLTEEEWDKYENYWKNERHVNFKQDFDLEKEIDKTDYKHAWAAGFLDGEGCFQSHMYLKGKTRVEVQAAQVDQRPLNLLKEMYGGSIYIDERSKTSNNRDCGKWSIHSAYTLRRILPLWIPHLVYKKEQAEKLLELCFLIGGKGRHSTVNEPGNAERRKMCIEELSRLKRDTQ